MKPGSALAVLSAVVIGSQSPWFLHAQLNNSATNTVAQANAGKTIYLESCGNGHGPNTDDGEFAPPLKGAAFRQKYAGKPMGELISYMMAASL